MLVINLLLIDWSIGHFNVDLEGCRCCLVIRVNYCGYNCVDTRLVVSWSPVEGKRGETGGQPRGIVGDIPSEAKTIWLDEGVSRDSIFEVLLGTDGKARQKSVQVGASQDEDSKGLGHTLACRVCPSQSEVDRWVSWRRNQPRKDHVDSVPDHPIVKSRVVSLGHSVGHWLIEKVAETGEGSVHLGVLRNCHISEGIQGKLRRVASAVSRG